MSEAVLKTLRSGELPVVRLLPGSGIAPVGMRARGVRLRRNLSIHYTASRRAREVLFFLRRATACHGVTGNLIRFENPGRDVTRLPVPVGCLSQ